MNQGWADLDRGLFSISVAAELALVRRRPIEDAGISAQGDTGLWRSWLALTAL